MDCDKDFIGKEKLCVLKEEGPKRNLLGFTVEESIGYTLVDKKAKKGDKVKVVTSKGEVEVTLQERMFYDPKRERVRA